MTVGRSAVSVAALGCLLAATQAPAPSIFVTKAQGTVKTDEARQRKEAGPSLYGTDRHFPKCPVYPSFEAAITVSGLRGTVAYRWERSTGYNSELYHVPIPATAQSGSVVIPLRPDGWPITQSDKQFEVSDRLHVLSPMDAASGPIELKAKCF